MADVGERPARLDPHVDVDAAPAGGLREADVAELVQQLAGRRGHPDGVREVRARLGIEVEPQLVGVIDVGASHRPRVEGDRPHLRRPSHDGDLRRADLVGGAPGRELDARRLDVGRRAARDALLEERVAAALLTRGQDDARVHALGPALEGRGPLAEGAHDPRGDREVVLDHLELRDRRGPVRRREDHPLRIGDAEGSSACVDLDGWVRHGTDATGWAVTSNIVRAMSQENVEIVRRMLDAWNRRDLEAILALGDPEGEFVNSPTAVEPGTRRGSDEVAAVPSDAVGDLARRPPGDRSDLRSRRRDHRPGASCSSNAWKRSPDRGSIPLFVQDPRWEGHSVAGPRLWRHRGSRGSESRRPVGGVSRSRGQRERNHSTVRSTASRWAVGSSRPKAPSNFDESRTKGRRNW